MNHVKSCRIAYNNIYKLNTKRHTNLIINIVGATDYSLLYILL